MLGQGGFGLVYFAHDDQLQRLVAIKVPHAQLVAQDTDAEAYMAEARAAAKLDHPHVVPVFDVGHTEQFPCFVVSKYIDGSDLDTRLRQSRMSLHEAVDEMERSEVMREQFGDYVFGHLLNMAKQEQIIFDNQTVKDWELGRYFERG